MSELRSKTPEELGISNEEWVNLAESLFISWDITSWLTSGPVYELHMMQRIYLENYFGLNRDLTDDTGSVVE